MRCLPHPISGAVYQEIEGGLVRVEDKEKGKSGLFTWDGAFVEGDLTQADLHFLRFIGGPTLPAEKDIIWNFLPVVDPSTGIQTSLPPSRGGASKDGGQPQLIIAPYAGDPGKQTAEGARSASFLPQEFFLDNDRSPELLPEVYRKSAPYPGGPKKVNVARFFEQKYHDLEVERLWKKVWQMACRLDDIPEVGDYLVYKVANLEYIVVRTGEAEVKAHVNACLHRGRKLCDHDGERATTFRCPYHGWSWDIAGNLKDLTAEWDFPGIREEVSRLHQAGVALWGGFVFINPDPDAVSFEEYAGPEMLDHYRKFRLETRYKQAHVGKVIKANWKLIMEAFLEAYHIITTHPQLMLFGGDLADTRYDVFGNWSRLGHAAAGGSSPHRGIMVAKEKVLEIYQQMADFNREYLKGLIGDEVAQYSDAELVEQSFNNLFPNFSPWGGWARIVYRFRPIGNDPDECLMEAMLLAPWPEGKPKPPPARLRMLEPDDPWVTAEELGTLARIFDQDCGNVPQTHAGLKFKEPPYVIYSAYQESVIRGFHDKYEKLLGLNEGE
ncbi:MAG: aromatic ring-hydroxylating dioxygenase subunit alpha [Novosphingobium sp.]|jgi:phenylpropionate dioxygenase-like ring-hydroxylating dioxygenase large terminal subunit|nr:aromatic ring-hydroxylating dioxygenase subunit alpha [Novosphingobium sp.]